MDSIIKIVLDTSSSTIFKISHVQSFGIDHREGAVPNFPVEVPYLLRYTTNEIGLEIIDNIKLVPFRLLFRWEDIYDSKQICK